MHRQYLRDVAKQYILMDRKTGANVTAMVFKKEAITVNDHAADVIARFLDTHYVFRSRFSSGLEMVEVLANVKAAN